MGLTGLEDRVAALPDLILPDDILPLFPCMTSTDLIFP
jgi:hypothetical protein